MGTPPRLPRRKCANPECNGLVTVASRLRCCHGCREKGITAHTLAAPPPVVETIEADRQEKQERSEIKVLRANYKEALSIIERYESEREALVGMQEGVESYAIEPRYGSGTSEATPVWVASDWHCEEKVGDEVGGLNHHDLETSSRRTSRFFTAGLRLTDLLAKDVTIRTIILALLGDFISNQIHGAENAEKNLLPPTAAIVFAQNAIVSGIDFILNHSTYELVIPCHSGNHGRTTVKTRFSEENGHSLEYLMFLLLAAHYRNEPRVKFIIPSGMHSYLDVYEKTIRFQHGHAIKYAGGVGGIFIPTYKAIAQWNKGRHADLDVFGHFHQMKDGGNFLCNGSVIGYNGFALSIKADYEEPKQTLFLMDKKRGRTATWPILVDK